MSWGGFQSDERGKVMAPGGSAAAVPTFSILFLGRPGAVPTESIPFELKKPMEIAGETGEFYPVNCRICGKIEEFMVIKGVVRAKVCLDCARSGEIWGGSDGDRAQKGE